MRGRYRGFIFAVLISGVLAGVISHHRLNAEDPSPVLPEFSVNGKAAELTVQDLSGLATRPLRLLIQRNNRARKFELMQVYALGVREGDDLEAEISVPSPGMRVTVYRLFRGEEGPRYLSMPFSHYFSEARPEIFREKMGPFDEEFLVVAYENTGSPDLKNIQVRYFEEKARRLVLSSFKTNITFSSLKFKLKDYGGDRDEKFFERDAQLLIDRFVDPRRIFMIRLWKIEDA